MGTRCIIGMQQKDGTVLGIYCHWDGYPEWVGKTLKRHYRTEEVVTALMGLGDLSSLGRTLGEKHPFSKQDSDYCTAYGRDRGESGTEAMIYGTPREFYAASRDCDAEFQYLFVNGSWVMSTGNGDEIQGC